MAMTDIGNGRSQAPGLEAPSRCELVEVARRQAELTVEQLWLRAIGLGGFTGLLELDAYLQGLVALDELEQDILAIGVDELRAQSRVPHRQLGRCEPQTERAIDQLLDQLSSRTGR